MKTVVGCRDSSWQYSGLTIIKMVKYHQKRNYERKKTKNQNIQNIPKRNQPTVVKKHNPHNKRFYAFWARP